MEIGDPPSPDDENYDKNHRMWHMRRSLILSRTLTFGSKDWKTFLHMDLKSMCKKGVPLTKMMWHHIHRLLLPMKIDKEKQKNDRSEIKRWLMKNKDR
jgi:hypothetical protein